MKVVWTAAVLMALCCSVETTHGQIFSLRTKNLQLVSLDTNHAFIVPHIARSFENSLRFHRRLFAYTPSEPVTVLLHDFNDYGTGGTNTIPWNYLSIGIEPYDYVYETSPTNERFNWVMNHELVHVLATDKAAGVDHVFRGMFLGKVEPTMENPLSMFYSWLTSPRWYSPRWYHEGIATFMETWMAGGIGRAQGGYDEMVFRTMVADSSHFYDYVGLESEGTTIDFQIGANSYLYGTRFMSYLADRYGPEKLLRWVNRTEDSRRTFGSQFEEVYDTSLADEWQRWVEWERGWQRANLDSVRRYPQTGYRPLVPEPLGSVSRAFYDSTLGKVYVAMNRPGQLACLVAVDAHTGEIDRLCDVLSPALYYVCSTAYDPRSGSLFYTTHNSSSWRDLNVVNVRTRDRHTLLKNARIGDLAFNPADSSLWGVQHHNGYSTLVRLPYPYDHWTEILSLKYGKDLYDIDVSPDGRHLVAALSEINGRQVLVRMNVDSLRSGYGSYETLYEFENNAPMNFVYASDGRSLYGSTYLTGVANVVRYDLASRTMDWLSNVETGLFRPLPLTPDSLLAFRYTGKGFLPVVLENRKREDVSAIRYLGYDVVVNHPVVTTWKIPPPSSIDLDSLITDQGPYEPWSHMGVASLYPMLEGYKVYTGIGVRLNLQDDLAINRLVLSGSVSPQAGLPDNERFHAAAQLTVWQWKLSAEYNRADFYDLFGPTRTSRKGYSLGLEYKDYFFLERPESFEYSLAANGYWGLERLPDYQNIATSFDRFYTLSGVLRYSFMLRSLGAVDYERGILTALSLDATVLRSVAYPRLGGRLDYGFALPWDHASLWIRTTAGYSPGDPAEPSANFYFGGFGNNWVDHGNVQRYREYYSFPGVELNSIGGTNFVRVLAEFDLPPIRFRRAGIPAFYCTWIRLALFGGAVSTNIDRAADGQRAVDIGAQLDCKLVLFSNLSSTLSFGYAAAVEQDRRLTKEFMISLKLL